MNYEKLNTETNTKEIKRFKNYGFILYYLLYITVGLYLRNIDINITVDIGDYGKFLPALLFSLSVVAIRWMPYIGLVGFILTLKKDSLKDIVMLYFLFSLIVIVSTTVILYFIL